MERSVQNEILLHIGKCFRFIRLFRNNVGMGWAGKFIKKNGDAVLIGNARPLHAGLIAGSGDLIGWTSVEITPEMVGMKIAIFTSVEVKTETGEARKEQLRWIDNVTSSGGIACIARSPEEVGPSLKLAFKYLPNDVK